MKCPECGTVNPEGVKYCHECAAPLSSAPPLSSDTLAERLQRLIPQEYAERLRATRGQLGHERRLVTILFCDVKGSTAMAEGLDAEEVLEVMDGAFEFLIAPVYRHEGTLARLMGDAILAFFGAPLAHEDDPERAIRAALEMVAGAQAYAQKLEQERGIRGFNVRVGINTGRVVVGEVGSDLRAEYTAMGDAVNLAARMEQSAPPGGILITQATYRHVRGVFDVQAQPLLQVKGKAEPVQSYLVERAKPRAWRMASRGVEGIETRMVGRDAELVALQVAYRETAEDHEARVVTVVGEPGVGKSRLLDEFTEWLELERARVWYLRGRATTEGRAVGYSLWRDLFAYRFDILETDTAAEALRKFRAGMEGLVEPERADLVGQLVGFDFSASPVVADLLGGESFQLMVSAYLVQYLSGLAAQGPVVVLLEDLHWADDSSLDLLAHTVECLPGAPLLVVGAARPELLERRPNWGEGQEAYSRLELTPLSKRASRALVQEILQKVRDVPEAVQQLVVEGSEGNPFYAEELVKMLIEDGAIVPGEEEWHVELERLAQIQVPPTLTAVLQARLDALPREEKEVLQRASVVGREFWGSLVGELASDAVRAEEVYPLLGELRGRELVYRRERSAFAGTEEYLFRHSVLRDVTYETVLLKLRRRYHAQVASWLEGHAGERVAEYLGLIAGHYELALRGQEGTRGDEALRDKAIEYLLRAGDRARLIQANQQAVGYYRRALLWLEQERRHDIAARTLMKLGLTYHAAQDFVRAREAFDEGFAMWQRAAQSQPARQTIPPHALRSWQLEPVTLEPATVTDWHSGVVMEQLFSSLVRLGPDMEVLPEAATSWEVLEGGRVYIFHLRPDARWSDGTPVTARDFEYSCKRTLDPARAPNLAAEFLSIKGARAYQQGQVSDPDSVAVRSLDDVSLVFELELPDRNFLHLIAYAVPVPRHLVELHGDAWTEPGCMVSNGPFYLESWRAGESMALARSPHYRGRFDGNLRRVELSFGPHTAAFDAYEANRLDILALNLVPPAEMDRMRRRYPGEYLSGPDLSTFHLRFDLSRAPFCDRRVRRALALATDRIRLANVILGGHAFAATGGLVPPAMGGHSPGIALPYSPLEARKLLAEAGYPGGRGFPEVELLMGEGREAAVADLQAQWQDALQIQVIGRTMAWAGLLDRAFREPPHILGSASAAHFPDPENFVGPARRHDYHASYAWHHPAYERLAEQAAQATDRAERLGFYQRMDQIVVEEAWMLPLSYGRRHQLVKPWVVRLPTSPIMGCFWKDVIIEPH